MAGESRTELISWINDLLQLNYTKVEQCGSGAVYCQIVDSIFGDVAMAKVKMQAKQEYEYLANFRVLQNSFKVHGIDKPIPVDRLVRCKMQDNLEFLQWLKRFWDMNFPGGEYDAVARRGAAGAGLTPVRATSPRLAAAAARTSATRAAPGAARVGAPSARSSSAASSRGVDPAALEALTSQMNEMKLSVEGLEKERDFYFNKLRDIEIIIGARLELAEQEPDGSGVTDAEKETLLQMQQILYSTEEGFEVPDDVQEELVDEAAAEEEETF
ncbi:RP/EB family microtubule-associated protein [Rhodotorula diobovata]|uniref:RP/EB family microtubule-associated protein n=1 Tax=Rhodotorula diobovata TaxID=5288 RepID=A0A5C5FQQ5_9BASI|nr:RP/EB family microtubule-associated protein [Rhodotorula diobovata]